MTLGFAAKGALGATVGALGAARAAQVSDGETSCIVAKKKQEKAH